MLAETINNTHGSIIASLLARSSPRAAGLCAGLGSVCGLRNLACACGASCVAFLAVAAGLFAYGLLGLVTVVTPTASALSSALFLPYGFLE